MANWLSICPEELRLGWTGIFEVPRDHVRLRQDLAVLA